MLSCCSKTCAMVMTGVAGAAIGVLATNAIDAQPVTQPQATTEHVTFQPEIDPEAMMAMMKEWGAPVEQHELLAGMAGSWDCTTKFWMGGPDAIEGTGSCENMAVLGGRYVTQHFKMPDFMGMEFEGMGAVGYDKAKDKFVSVWLDNFSTTMMTMEGTWDDDSQTMTWTGKAVYPDGLGGAAEVPVKHLIKHEGDDKMVMEFWEPNPATGEMSRTGEITYTRR